MITGSCKMLRTFVLCLWIVSVVGAQEQNSSSNGTIQGNYTGALRPQIHFSPPKGFMNDPNGLFRDAKGIWHLYYQYNPTDVIAGNQHWGHATSDDLYHWKNQPIAISPDHAGDGIFSGSAVIDVNNTSGMFPNQTDGVVAMYTLNTAEEQSQNVAFSTDGGYTFTKYSKNPVISVNSMQFRDPKVIYHKASKKWIAVISYAQEFTLGFYTSSNLLEWTHASNFSHAGLLGVQYECPNLIPFPVEGSAEMQYALTVSINPGAPSGGSITQYWPGSFDGKTFTPVDRAARIADFGKDNYAGQFFFTNSETEAPVSIAWASNWQYAQNVPTGTTDGYRSSMTLPRSLQLVNESRIGYDLVSKPYGLDALYDKQLVPAGKLENDTKLLDFSNVPSQALYFRMNVTNIPETNATGTANITFTSSVSGESLRIGLFLGGDVPFFIDRGHIDGFENPFFTDKASINLIPNATRVVEGVIDRSLLEVFLDEGQHSATSLFFPENALDQISIATAELNQNVSVSIQVQSLKGVWTD